MKFHIDGHEFEAADMRDGVLIDPILPLDFDHMPNEQRPASHQKFWHRPYVDTQSYRDRGLVVVHCLDGGAWDRSTMLGHFPTIDDAVKAITENKPWPHPKAEANGSGLYAFGVGSPTPYPAIAQGGRWTSDRAD